MGPGQSEIVNFVNAAAPVPGKEQVNNCGPLWLWPLPDYAREQGLLID